VKRRIFLGRQIIRRNEMKKTILEPRNGAELGFTQLSRVTNYSLKCRLYVRR
jgi:hypothetical protein